MSRDLGRRALSVAAARIAEGRARKDRAVDALAPAAAERLYALSDRLAHMPFRRQQSDVPPPQQIDGTQIDLVGELAAYTRLPEDVVRAALRDRRSLSFRSEWWATPPELRRDHWFYLSSKTYLFANAVHFPDTSFVDRFVRPYVPAGGAVLDFGGGAGGLTLALGAAGFDTWYSDLNALQRDFVRFRVARHELGERVRVLDFWDELPTARFDAVVAVDVLEHLEDGRDTVERLLDALTPQGVLAENSPFVTSAANPMHHEDFGLHEQLGARGFAPVLSAEDGTNVWSRGLG